MCTTSVCLGIVKLYSSVHKSTVHLWTDMGLSGVRKGNLDFLLGCDCDPDRHCDGMKTKTPPSLLTKDFGWSLIIYNLKPYIVCICS